MAKQLAKRSHQDIANIAKTWQERHLSGFMQGTKTMRCHSAGESGTGADALGAPDAPEAPEAARTVSVPDEDRALAAFALEPTSATQKRGQHRDISRETSPTQGVDAPCSAPGRRVLEPARGVSASETVHTCWVLCMLGFVRAGFCACWVWSVLGLEQRACLVMNSSGELLSVSARTWRVDATVRARQRGAARAHRTESHAGMHNKQTHRAASHASSRTHKRHARQDHTRKTSIQLAMCFVCGVHAT